MHLRRLLIRKIYVEYISKINTIPLTYGVCTKKVPIYSKRADVVIRFVEFAVRSSIALDPFSLPVLLFPRRWNADANGLIEFRLSKDGSSFPMPVPGSCCAMNQKQGAPVADVIIEIPILQGYLGALSLLRGRMAAALKY